MSGSIDRASGTDTYLVEGRSPASGLVPSSARRPGERNASGINPAVPETDRSSGIMSSFKIKARAADHRRWFSSV